MSLIPAVHCHALFGSFTCPRKAWPAGIVVPWTDKVSGLSVAAWNCTPFRWTSSDAEKAERLNHARLLLQQYEHVPEAVAELARSCSISPRQAYRYLEQAQQLKRPVAIEDAKVAFTVKLSRSLVRRLRMYATSTGLTLSEIVSRALIAVLNRGGGRG